MNILYAQHILLLFSRCQVVETAIVQQKDDWPEAWFLLCQLGTVLFNHNTSGSSSYAALWKRQSYTTISVIFLYQKAAELYWAELSKQQRFSKPSNTVSDTRPTTSPPLKPSRHNHIHNGQGFNKKLALRAAGLPYYNQRTPDYATLRPKL
jgi:hypothetical protein